MKHLLVKKYGPFLGLAVMAALVIGMAHLPSCQLSPEQQHTLRTLSVPASKILSKAAVSQGWVEPGDEITIQRGIAVVVSDADKETKLYQLAEIGLDRALHSGFMTVDDKVTVNTPTEVTITDGSTLPPDAQLTLPSIPPVELKNELLPPPPVQP